MGESNSEALRLDFDRRLILQFRGSVVTSDAGLLPYRELDDALGLSVMAGETLADARTGTNGRHALVRREASCSTWVRAKPHPWRTGNERLERPLRLHLLSSVVPVQSVWRSGKMRSATRQCSQRVGFILTNMARSAENVVGFYNKRGTCEQWIKEGKGAIKWTRLSCRSFAANAARLQLHALAYNLGNFLRTLATPEPIKDWSMASLKEKLIKIGAKVVSHGRYVAFQMGEIAIPRNLFADILRLIAELRPPPNAALA